MSNQEILDNAPEGATHVNHKNKYFWFDGDNQFIYKPKTDEWLMTFYHENKLDLVRSLADIKRIVKLEARQVRADELIVELHKQVYGSPYLDNKVGLYKALKEKASD